MLMDKLNLLSDKQALTTGAGASTLSTNTIDLGVVGSIPLGVVPIYDIGRGEAVDLLIQVVTDFTSGGAATLRAEVVIADTADLATNLVVLTKTDDIALATLKAGYQFRVSVVPHGVNKQYLGVRYFNASAAAFTGGAVTAGVLFDRQTNPVV